jgi:hypothetical protein
MGCIRVAAGSMGAHTVAYDELPDVVQQVTQQQLRPCQLHVMHAAGFISYIWYAWHAPERTTA